VTRPQFRIDGGATNSSSGSISSTRVLPSSRRDYDRPTNRVTLPSSLILGPFYISLMKHNILNYEGACTTILYNCVMKCAAYDIN
jgi:hypothetical protein